MAEVLRKQRLGQCPHRQVHLSQGAWPTPTTSTASSGAIGGTVGAGCDDLRVNMGQTVYCTSQHKLSQ
jgi:hypothetical protein